MTKSTLRVEKFRKFNPWFRPEEYAKRRCTDKHHKSYPCYGGRGIKYLLSKAELLKLWFRDKAHRLHKPSLDRKNPDGHYEFSNCRFVELAYNQTRKRPPNSIEYKETEKWEE